MFGCNIQGICIRGGCNQSRQSIPGRSKENCSSASPGLQIKERKPWLCAHNWRWESERRRIRRRSAARLGGLQSEALPPSLACIGLRARRGPWLRFLNHLKTMLQETRLCTILSAATGPRQIHRCLDFWRSYRIAGLICVGSYFYVLIFHHFSSVRIVLRKSVIMDTGTSMARSRCIYSKFGVY